MITDEDDDVLNFKLQLEEEYSIEDEEDKDQHMTFCPPRLSGLSDLNSEEGYHTEEQNSVYQELAEKDHYLILAAEAGKALLEKNQELENQFQNLQEEYLQKVEALEEERHHLKREIHEREYNYESRMQDMQHELSFLSGRLETVQKVTRNTEQSNKNNLDDIQSQNSSVLQELSEVKNYNQDLAQQVQTLKKRLDGRLAVNSNQGGSRRSSGLFPDYDAQDGRTSDEDVHYEELKNLKAKVQKLTDEKDQLEESFHDVSREKDVIYTDHKSAVGKMSVLETEILSLKQQIGICQEDLNKTKKKNGKLKDQLEEYVLLQSQNMGRRDSHNNSLFNELEMSLSEADRNMQHVNSTPNSKRHDDDDGNEYDDMPETFLNKSVNKSEIDKMSAELKSVYLKLRSLKNKLSEKTHGEHEDKEDDSFTTDMLSKLVDQVIHLIEERILSLGAIDQRMESPRIDLDIEEDNLSLPESRLSDTEVDLLEQKVLELNQRLNIKTTECENAKKELEISQTSAVKSQERAEELNVMTNKQEREIDALRKERDILLADTTMEEKLKQALQERDEALMKANELLANQEQSSSDMHKLNNQLISAVQKNVELGEQLEEWQDDMASIIHQQLSTQIKKDQKKSRKRSSTSNSGRNTGRSMLAKLFPGRNNSRETSQCNTPQAKSPVPPK